MQNSIPQRGGKREGAGRKGLPPARRVHMEDDEFWILEAEAKKHGMDVGEYIVFLRRSIDQLRLRQRD
jgi:hypothetical protein